ncbi:ABC transporter permease [Phytomonospora endophytica]|uniref:Putative ABC transport system permease protein n=1 Tax=Phytomonospora endophytica TaxID=714109 RepID=A0A841F8X3_9ACTN|nr:ABC transporter permease [Phytomonospora endophytica]MBB6033571.1 putative ABC transport system permease protein [Phytomonospora endophytica]GIG64913.1 ABC transporter permease [Phytomonospora endophytica]
MFIAWRDLRFAKGRFALLGGVIALMTLMVVLLTGLTAGLGAASVSAVEALPADHIAFQEPAEGQEPAFATSELPGTSVAELGALPGVDTAHGMGVSTARLNVGGGSAAVNLIGTDPSLYPDREDGTDPGAGEVAVTAELAETHGLAPGSTVDLNGRSLTVTAIVDTTTLNHLPVVYLPLATWQELASTDTITAVALTGDPGETRGAVTLTREDAYGAVGGYSSEQGSLTLMRGLLLGVSVLIVGAFFTVWTMQRSGDLAVVRAIGAGRGYLLRDALGQALAVLVLGSAVGGAVAAGLGALAARAVPFVLDAQTVGVPVASMIAVGLLGAAVCVRRTTTVDPLTALGAAR